MTADEAQLAYALARCKMVPGSYNKRFSRDLAGMAHQGKDLTDPQRRNLLKLVIRYRRQIPADLVELAKQMQAAVPNSVRED